jgi:hypothetical protein
MVATLICPRNGANPYACTSGSMFVGCCKINPCENGCGIESLSPAQFKPDDLGKSPDASCGTGAQFYSCASSDDSSGTFWGCCKSNPCTGTSCPLGDIIEAFMDKPVQIQFFTASSSSTTSTILSSPTSSMEIADGPPITYSRVSNRVEVNQSNAKILVSIPMSIIISLCVSIGLWICYRRFITRAKDESGSVERYVPYEPL